MNKDIIELAIYAGASPLFSKDEPRYTLCGNEVIIKFAELIRAKTIADMQSEQEPVAFANKDLTLATTVKGLDGSMRNKECGFGNDGVPLFTHAQPATKQPIVDEREAFEAHMIKTYGKGINLNRDTEWIDENTTTGLIYLSENVEHEWHGWKSRAQLSSNDKDGYVNVPVEPTDEMLQVGEQNYQYGEPSERKAGIVYKAMIAAIKQKQ